LRTSLPISPEVPIRLFEMHSPGTMLTPFLPSLRLGAVLERSYSACYNACSSFFSTVFSVFFRLLWSAAILLFPLLTACSTLFRKRFV